MIKTHPEDSESDASLWFLVVLLFALSSNHMVENPGTQIATHTF